MKYLFFNRQTFPVKGDGQINNTQILWLRSLNLASTLIIHMALDKSIERYVSVSVLSKMKIILKAGIKITLIKQLF